VNWAALRLIGLAVADMAVSGIAYATVEHLPVTTGWYWALETATTVGYGDVTPQDATGRLIASLVMLTAIPLLAMAFAKVTGAHLAAWWHKHNGGALLAEVRAELAAHRKSVDEQLRAHRDSVRRDLAVHLTSTERIVNEKDGT
jgi:hypothetical protein